MRQKGSRQPDSVQTDRVQTDRVQTDRIRKTGAKIRRENLVQTDYGIVMTRNRLRKAANDLKDKGVMPPGRDPEHMKVRSIAVVLDTDLKYADACQDEMQAEDGKIRATV